MSEEKTKLKQNVLAIYLASIWGVTSGLLYGPAARKWLIVTGIDKDAVGPLAFLSALSVAAASCWLVYGAWIWFRRHRDDRIDVPTQEEIDAVKRKTEMKQAQAEERRATIAAMSMEELHEFDFRTEEYQEYRRRMFEK